MVNARASGDIVIAISNQTYNTFSPPRLDQNSDDLKSKIPIQNGMEQQTSLVKDTPGFGKLIKTTG